MRAGSEPASRIAYGSAAAQFVDWTDAPGAAVVVALLHGGYWRARFDLELMAPLARAASGADFAVANIEYRRGEGWREAVADVGVALAAVRHRYPAATLVVVGHSAGGHLALLHSEAVDLVVALAPVTDLARGYRDGIGEGAVGEFMGTPPEDDPGAYVSASPDAAALRTRTLLVHGADDARVPSAYSRRYVAAAREVGAPLDHDEPASLGHLALIDPGAPHWPRTWEWIARESAAARGRSDLSDHP